MKNRVWPGTLLLILFSSQLLAYDKCHELGLDQCNNHARDISACQDQVYGSMPKDQPNEIKVCHHAYLVGANTLTKDPDWVAYHLTAEHLENDSNRLSAKRADYFCPDPCLPPGQRAEEVDYKGLFPAFNRGHMNPAEDNIWDKVNAYKECYFYSNMLPQVPGNNRGIWAELEHNVDIWAKQRGDLYIIDGPVYDYNGLVHQVVGADGVWAPVALYKIIYDPHANQVLAFIIPNKTISNSRLIDYLVSVDQVNALTQLNLLADLPDAIKTQTPMALWEL